MLQRPKNFHYTNLVISVIAILLAACSTGTESTNTSTDSASSPSIDTASSSSPSPADSPASADMLGVSNVSEINFKDASKNSPSGYFDGINGSSAREMEVPKSNPLTVRGWAILPDKGRPADKVIITSGDNNSLVAVAPVNIERPDVVKNLKNPDYRNSGWNITLNPSTLPTDRVVLKAWAYNSESKEATQLNSTREVVILN